MQVYSVIFFKLTPCIHHHAVPLKVFHYSRAEITLKNLQLGLPVFKHVFVFPVFLILSYLSPPFTCHLTAGTYHLSHVSCHLPAVSLQLTADSCQTVGRKVIAPLLTRNHSWAIDSVLYWYNTSAVSVNSGTETYFVYH